MKHTLELTSPARLVERRPRSARSKLEPFTSAGQTPLKKPLLAKEVLEEVKQTFPDFEVESAPQERVGEESLKPYLRRILDALRIENAWISDESLLSDFIGSDIARLAELERILSIKLSKSQYLFEIAERLRDRPEN